MNLLRGHTQDNAYVQARMPTPLGEAVLWASTRGATPGLAGIWFAKGQRYLPEPDAFARWPRDDQHPVLQAACQQLRAYFAGQLTVFELPLDLSTGTPFQQAVWQALLAIPLGQTCTYGDISRRIGKPQAVRAVGAAVGQNPISIIVPCHRVIGADGTLTGYAGGLERKVALLQLEGVMAPASGPSSATPTISRKTRATRGATPEHPRLF